MSCLVLALQTVLTPRMRTNPGSGRSDTTCDNHGDKCASSLSSARPQQGSDRPQHSDTNGQ